MFVDIVCVMFHGLQLAYPIFFWTDCDLDPYVQMCPQFVLPAYTVLCRRNVSRFSVREIYHVLALTIWCQGQSQWQLMWRFPLLLTIRITWNLFIMNKTFLCADGKKSALQIQFPRQWTEKWLLYISLRSVGLGIYQLFDSRSWEHSRQSSSAQRAHRYAFQSSFYLFYLSVPML